MLPRPQSRRRVTFVLRYVRNNRHLEPNAARNLRAAAAAAACDIPRSKAVDSLRNPMLNHRLQRGLQVSFQTIGKGWPSFPESPLEPALSSSTAISTKDNHELD